MKRIIVTLALFFCLTTAASAAELLMFSMKSCPYCRDFLKEVAQEYKDTEHAKVLPLRIISMDRPVAPRWFDDAYNRRTIDGVAGTPTFIIFDSGEEIARLVGYTSKGDFYSDIGKFIKQNRKKLENGVGRNPIPFEKDTEMTPKYALQESLGEAPDRTNSSDGFSPRSSEGSHNKKEMSDPTDSPLGPMNEFGDARVPPPGVKNSRDLFQHMYKTPKEAVKASHWFGCNGTVHYHDKEDVWMPCEMN